MLEGTCARLVDESQENQALYYTIKGAILKSLKKESDAVVYFEKVLEMHQRLKNTEVHCALFSYEEIGEISFARKDYAKAEKCFKEVVKHADSKHLFFSEALQRRAYIALRQLKEAESQPVLSPKGPEKNFFTLAKDDAKDRERQERELQKEREREEKKDKKKKASLAERCALNRGTSFILTVEKKAALQTKE
eukprot:Phypoly_transcript_09835.p2 GENE.Phypoly_transcript_09835~~Phypoly_transcript_09835.p2  ORF type:complete len:193 (+),score=52.60 Phypoly_transcript_09835:605-1183(+)